MFIISIVIVYSLFSDDGAQSEVLQPQTNDTLVLNADDVKSLENALNSTDRFEQERALVPALRNGEWTSSAVLPEGASLQVDRDTFKISENGYGQVRASVTGSVEAEFVLYLKSVNQEWLIYMTETKR
ncbi:MAG TPA: hypothetical protein VFM68_00035 [Candidatus Saccharimonadales bacterium]|nr:hypothetical protein [Candidatus Saccharimonadales bacterium]